MKAKKILSVLLGAAMVLSMLTMSVMAAPAEGMPPDGMPGGPGGPGEGGGASALTLADPGYKYQTIQNVTSVSDVKTLPSLNELADIVVGATVNGEEVTGLLTMTKDGVEVPVEEGSYTAADKVVITATNYLQDAGEDNQLEALGSWTAISGLPYRAALSIRDGKIVSDESVRSAISGTISGTAASGVKFESQTSGFSAMIIRDSDYKITNADINLDSKSDGKDVNDFAGYGAGVVVYGNSKVEIEDSNITTSGVAKAATFADAGADLIVRNSTLTSKGGDIYKDYKSTANQSYMINPPWVLGIAGSSRTTNVMGDYTTGTYVNTVFDAADWGAVSIDTGSYMHLTLINSAIKVAGSGYGAYAIGGGTHEDYYGTTFDVDTYAIIMTGATASLGSVVKGEEIEVRKIVADDDASNRSTSTKDGDLITTETATETANSVINSKNFGFMFHHNAANGWNVLNLNPGTEINTGNAAFLVKKINAEINVNGADVNSGNGVILQMIDNDDDGVGAFMDDFYGMPTFNYKYEEKDGWASTWGVDYKDSGWQTEFNVSDADLKGDLYNGTGYGSNGGSALNVNLGKGASLTGVISSTETQHGDSLDNLYKSFIYRKDDEGFSYDTAAEAAGKLGHVINQNYYNGVNPVNVTLTDDAAWTVTGNSIVNNLSAKSTAVTAEKPVIISVKGTLTLDGKQVTDDVTTVGNVTYVITFQDVPANTWYVGAVDYVAAKGIMNGTGNHNFGGKGTVTRGTVATLLARMSGVDTEGGAQWYSKGMEWAIANGITENTNATEAVSRQEIITMLWHLDEPEATGSLIGFSDGASTADWAREAMAWAVGAGVIQGHANGSLAPTATLTRAQLAQIFYNYYTKAAK